LVATASREDIPTMIISGTLMSELPPVIAPTADVATINTVSRAIWVSEIIVRAIGVEGEHIEHPRVGRLYAGRIRRNTRTACAVQLRSTK
jgi:hypothetical protein